MVPEAGWIYTVKNKTKQQQKKKTWRILREFKTKKRDEKYEG